MIVIGLFVKKSHYFCKFVVYNRFKMNKIKQVLDNKGVKQTWLAGKLGKSLNTVNSYVHNRCQPSLDTLYKIANLLNVEIDDLLYSKEEFAKMDR